MSDSDEELTPVARTRLPYEPEPELEQDTNAEEKSIEDAIANEMTATDDDLADVPVEITAPQYTAADIPNLLQPIVNLDISRKQHFVSLVKMSLDTVTKISGRKNRKHTVLMLMQFICAQRDIIARVDMAKFVLTVKAKFNDFIRRERFYELIPLYNMIFNDGLYDNIELQPAKDIITDEEIDEYINQYNESLIEYHERNNALRTLPLYEKGEVVGAKDKEGKWWMSEVLEVFKHGKHNMYYVAFKGWGDRFNEFITESHRIRRYNPRAHIYYRPAWKRKQNPENAQKEKTAF